MSTHRYPGGVISATPPTATSAGAVGVWTLEEALRNKAAGNWPNGAGTDPYFRNVTLLLNGDGTNGAQNNTFLDSSTNNLTITRNGNTTQGTFDPYAGPGNWSDFYATTSSGWQTPANSITSILGSTFSSSATFTVEAWIYPLSRHSGGGAVLGYVLGSLNLTGANADWAWGPDSNGNLVLFWYQGGNQICKSTSIIPLNTWTHIALSVSAGAIKLFINGVLETTTGASTINLSAPALTYVSSGGYVYGGTTWQGFNGYISNLRVIGKRAAYTTTFTPSTTPLVATSDTTLLTCQQNGFVDSSADNWTLTTVGGVQVSKFSPFTLYQNTPASYSGYFDGTGDYLTFPQSALQFGTSDFTVEAWVYFSAIVTDQYIFNYASSGPTHVGINYYSGAWRIGGFNSYLVTGGTASVGQWYHVAMVRSANNLRAYINGTQIGSTVSVSGVTFSASGIGYIGAYYSTQGNNFNGSISNLRITNGVAVYTSAFTPPTSPLTAISGTSLLTCQSTTFIDNSTNAFTITANGNARPRPANPFTDTVSGPTAYSTSVYGGSAYFDGTGDYLTTPATGQFAPAGNFAISCWVNISSLAAQRHIIGNYASNAAGNWIIEVTTAGTLQVFLDGATLRLSNTGLVANTWYHILISRVGTTVTGYLNGALFNTIATYTLSGTFGLASQSIYIGIRNGGTNPMLGYISGIQLVDGSSLFSGPFVPPTSPPTAITGTNLLLNSTNAGIFDNTTVNDIETVGAAQISTSVVKYGTGSISFNGTTSSLVAQTSNPVLWPGSGSFTIEYWLYLPANPTTGYYTHFSYGTSGSVFRVFNTAATAKIEVFSGASVILNPAWPTAGQWNHFALVRNGTTLTLYINGAAAQSVTNSTDFSTGTLNIGSEGASNYLNGYIDDMRITKGIARYTTNFTPPTAAFSNI